MVDKLLSASGSTWPVAKIEVQNANGINVLDLFATTDRVYDQAQKLSKAFPECRVTVGMMARFRVIFKNGTPLWPTKPMTEFYSNLTEEQIKESLISVGAGVWV